MFWLIHVWIVSWSQVGAFGAVHGLSAGTEDAIWLNSRIVASISTSDAGLAGGISPL